MLGIVYHVVNFYKKKMKQNSSTIEYPLGEYACAGYGFTGCMHFNYKGRVRILIDKHGFY